MIPKIAIHPIQLQLIPNQTHDNVAYQHLRLTLITRDRVIQPSDLQGLTLPKDLQFSQVGVESRVGNTPCINYQHIL